MIDETAVYARNQKGLMAGMITFGLLAAIYLCMIIVGRRSLKLAIDTIDASADFLFKTKRIILVPIFYFFVTLLVIFLWLGGLICVLSMNPVKPSTLNIP